MDSGAISQLVFFVFAAIVLIYGYTLYRDLARLRDANDRARARLDAALRERNNNENSANLQDRIAIFAAFNEDVRRYNACIGGFPQSIVAAIMGLRRRDLYQPPHDAATKPD